MAARFDALFEITQEIQPVSVRGVFYQASSVRQIIEKTERGYGKVQRGLVDLRRGGRLPWHWIADNTRWVRKPRTFHGPADAAEETARFYRKAIWADVGEHVEVWIEKDALAGVIYPVTSEFDVPLMVSRGYASLSFLYEAATDIAADGRPAHIYHLGDFDPSGVDAANKIEATLREFAPRADISFARLAVLPEQIYALNLPTRPTKRSDSRAKGFGDFSVELDAIDPRRLRQLVRDALELHLPAERFEVLKVAEESERRMLEAWAESVG